MIKKINFDFLFFKKALKVLIPIVFSSVVIVAISFIDGVMVNGFHREGQAYAKIDYAAVGIAGEIWFAFESFFFATAILFGILFSQFSHNKKIFVETAKFNFWFATVVTISISAVMYFASEQLVNLFFLTSPGPEAEYIKPIAYDYCKILALGHLFLSASFALTNPLTIKGKAHYVFWLSIVSLVLNVVLDYIFIYDLDQGAQGSAWATTISYFAQFIISLWFIYRHRDWFEGFWKLFKIQKFILFEIFKRSWIFITMVLMQMGWGFYTSLLMNLYSSDLIKPMAVGYTVSSILFSVFAGTNRGVKIFVGPLLGQGKFEEAKKVSHQLLFPNIFLASIFMVAALISSTFFPSLMLDNKKEIKIAKSMIYSFTLALPAYLISAYFSSTIETSGFQLTPNIWNYFFQIWFITPFTIIFSHYGANLDFELNFLSSQLLAYVATFVLFIIYRKYKWLKRIEEY